MGDSEYGLDPPTVDLVAKDIISVHKLGVEILSSYRWWKYFRGLQGSAKGMERTTADYMGMLATIMNACNAISLKL